MQDKLGDKARLQHILDAIISIQGYVSEASYKDFMANPMMQDACVWQLQIIGEASSKVSQELKETQSEIPWQDMKKFRNIAAHQYFGIDENIIWDIIQQDLDTLRKQVFAMLEKIE